MQYRSRARAMLAATLAMFAVIAFLAIDGDRRAFGEANRVAARFEGRDTVVLAWRGEVRAPMARRFEEAFAEWRDQTPRFVIELSSSGGQLAEGAEVIAVLERMKRTHQVDTRVAPYDVCLSMCVPIYLRGERRIASRSSRFMFHEPTAVDFYTEEVVRRPAFERRIDADRFYARFLAASDMNPEWGEGLRAAWEGRDVWKTGRELIEEGANIVTELR